LKVLAEKLRLFIKGQVSARYKIFVLALSVIGAVFILLATSRYGVGIVTDSVGYLAAARSIISGDGVIGHLGIPLTDWPPLYPVVLALFGFILNTDPLLIANVVNAILFGSTIYVVGLLTRRYFKYMPILGLLTTASVLFSMQIFVFSVKALSEPLFLLFTALAFLHANSYSIKKDITSLVLLAVAAGLSSLTRYLGISLILFGIGIILLYHNSGLKTKIIHLLVFLIISSLPIGLWLIRNYSVSGTLFGERHNPIFTLEQEAVSIFNTLLNWYIPQKYGSNILVFIPLAIVITLFYLLAKKLNIQSAKEVVKGISIFILFILIYISLLLISSTTTAYDNISDRLMLPIFIPVAFLFFKTGELIINILQERFHLRAASIFVKVFISLWLLYSMKSILFYYIPTFSKEGAGTYNTKLWRESATMQYLHNNSNICKGYAVYTNASDALYFFTGLHGKWVPTKHKYNSPDKGPEIVKGNWPIEEEAYLVWSYKTKWDNQYSLEELKKIADMKEMNRFNDGVVFFINKNKSI
jgi:hypothetical protein